ncbi:hypothetical protein BDQ12DRAFT_672351 [Crucibulum laeve]|uniref:Uncharacterized protein n=1 Tax=Crucibulum laeve TaxID=68775 RepID=A0A5C3MJK8_9AGAR|nr:hypothetical protein BDQ12DRAFT_672351 [Crucibulum laeve]
MSARQNKKQRKGRNNPNNRERTVTTLTEDPNSSYLVPTPSEEPAGAALISAFAVNTPSVNPNNIPAQVFPMAPNFTFGYNGFAGPMHGNVHHQQHQPQQQNFFPQPQAPSIMLPPGKNDLEILENLKEMIKQGQHEFYRAVPQPAALASLYLGPSAPPQHQVAHHPEQAPHDYHANDAQQQQQVPNQANADPTSPIDVGRRPPRMQNKEGWDPSGRKPIVPGPQPQNNVLSASSLRPLSAANTTFSQNIQAHNQQPTRYNGDNSSRNSLSNINTSSLNTGNIGTGPPSATVKNEPDVNSSVPGGGLTDSPSLRSARYDSAAQRLPGVPPSPGAGNQKVDQPRPLNDRLDHGESGYGGSRPTSGDISSEKNAVYDSKDDLARGREGWSHRDGPHPSDDRRHEPDRAGRPPGVNGQDHPIDRSIDRGPPMPPPLRDDRYPDRDRDERDRDRDRRRDWPPYDRDRDRRPYERPRDPRELRAPDMRRPDSRHYEPEYDRPPVRRFDGKDEPPMSAGGRRLSDARSPPIDDRVTRPPPPVDDRLSSARPPVDSRPSVDSRPPLDHRALPDSRAPPPDDRSIRGPPPPPSNDRRGPPPDPRPGSGPFSSDRPAPPTPVARPTSAASRVPEDRSARPPPTPVEDRSARPQVPLEDRLSRPPSLQDRLNTPPASRVPEPERFTRQASLEERIAPAGDHNGRPPPVGDHIRLSNATPDRERDRVPPRPVPGDERSRTSMPDPRVSSQDDRPVRPDDRGVRPEDRGVRPDVRVRSDDRSIRPDDRGVRPPDDRGIRPLNDHGVHPDDRAVRPDDRRPEDRVVRPDERRPDERGRPVGGYSRPITPVAGSAPPGHRPYPPPLPQSQPPRPVAASARDDPRAVKPPQSPHRLPPRDYRPIDRDASRERPDVRPSSYHPDDRSYHDRRPDAMDVDAPRYESRDTRPSYDRPPFSPSSAADLARDHQRRANPFPPEPPRATPAAAPVDTSYDDRRYSGPPPARDWQYNERRARDYPPESDYKGRAAWDRSNPPPSSDRDRFDRERDTRDTRDVPPPPRNHGWDPRDVRDARPQDRDVRDYPPPRAASPPRSFDSQRPLGPRVADTYPAPAPSVHVDDRSYPPRDADRRPPSSHVLPPSYAGRVRPRSASPARRIPPGPADDPRPPMKRQREDYPPAEYSYPPGGGRDLPRRTDYPPRPGSPPHPPPGSGSSYYDRPPIIPSAVAASAPNAPDRDYARDRVPGTHDYPPSSYERPRSPGQASRMSQTYNRGGYTGSRDTRDPRDTRPYMPPPPPRAP